MSFQENKEEITLTLMEAVDTLSHIAEFGSEQIEVNQSIKGKKRSKSLFELCENDTNKAMHLVKSTFRVVLKYLKSVYGEGQALSANAKTVERIKTIMVLVGEAAQKLDKYTNLFKKAHCSSVTELKEYKQLQEFYVDRVARKIDDDRLGRLILDVSQDRVGSTRLVGQFSKQANHIFVDPDSIKKDTDYELLFLRKEDGTKFYTPRLLRSLILMNDFSQYVPSEGSEALFIDSSEVSARSDLGFAEEILHSAGDSIDKFFRVAVHSPGYVLVEYLNKALMALMLAGNSHNLPREEALKDSRSYFFDFQMFLRECLMTREYQRIVVLPQEKRSHLESCSLDLIYSLCRALYEKLPFPKVLFDTVHDLIEGAREEQVNGSRNSIKDSYTVTSDCARDYAALSKWIAHYPNQVLHRTLDVLAEESCHSFDPLLQGNIPTLLYPLYVGDHKYMLARWPSPTYQEYIDRARINEEFKAFLRSYGYEPASRKCLLFNFQDRTSWKERSRCHSIEELPLVFANTIEVVTIPKDTEFYHQAFPYAQENRADVFIAQFKQQLYNKSAQGGYFFPEAIAKEISSTFIEGIIGGIHKIFFFGKNMLLQQHRTDFIELFHLFLELKIIDCIRPDIVGISCKDGLDTSSMVAGELFGFFKLLHQERLSESDLESLEAILYGPCLLIRERIVMQERFNRFLGLMKLIEGVRSQYGKEGFQQLIQEAFGLWYQTPILKGKVGWLN